MVYLGLPNLKMVDLSMANCESEPDGKSDDPSSTPSTGFSPSARLQLLNRFLQPFAFLVAAGTHLCLDTRRWQEVAGWPWLAPTGPSVWLVSGGYSQTKYETNSFSMGMITPSCLLFVGSIEQGPKTDHKQCESVAQDEAMALQNGMLHNPI